MTTLITVSNSEGLVGRCDANCYCAVEHECTCICGGKNHRVGFLQACKNTRELALSDEDIKKWADVHGLDPDDLEIATNDGVRRK